ncbi:MULTISPECIES: peptidoglycan recognition protein family protein [Clostridium]|uniref:N-acetylmuramoyl-L-alanine amidase n=1 Tax=Clostridium carnis TaxID=1530 RepID=A0ABY6T097_9CLOT|nr:peptidoglycan recognition family protein [Clostridium carnis]CAI3551629.1 putative N-acetylmuramoyl-L-alanine amidase [Clostridium neonatale]CAI3561068.1 putative N-acetylmuramoyl-L-alanine amidase [Clostridium neonatale]CAI3581917.1 putative N-acetylmuramoyl-L-alanine amidase [Clostridium neonatale]CAI3676309.1 putative N-acetylmuramoyl-L-alanine amidase [Clostridium neonatale]VDG74454.1 N-acetylmuramoyl-L-alanine amidase [Clostridium carnis]
MNIIDVGLKFKSLSYGNKPNKLVLHHAEASKCTVQDIHSWHLNNGWSGIGYHYFIRKDGSVYKGRPDGAIGSHCQGSNTGSLGICFEGNYMKETMPAAQYNAGIDLIKYLRGKYGNLTIYGHKELLATECPGSKFPLADFKNLKENEEKATGYIVTNYLPNGYRGDGSFVGVDLEYVLSYFKDIRCYVKGDSKGIWIETQVLPIEKCKELQKTLGSWFYAIR